MNLEIKLGTTHVVNAEANYNNKTNTWDLLLETEEGNVLLSGLGRGEINLIKNVSIDK